MAAFLSWWERWSAWDGRFVVLALALPVLQLPGAAGSAGVVASNGGRERDRTGQARTLNRPPTMERMTMAKMETTMLCVVCVSDVREGDVGD